MPAHQWELRADVRPLELAATRWSEVGQLMTQRADDLVGAARHALDSWDSAAAESYEQHRRQVIANLDQFTTLAAVVSSSLRALSSMITASQTELDESWLDVSRVPHQVVGPDRRLVFQEADDADRGAVARCDLEASEIRRRLTVALDQESARLRTARAEFMLVRDSLDELVGGAFPALLRTGVLASGVDVIGPAATSVRGTAESGVGVGTGVGVGVGVGLAPIGSISVSMPSLSGLATAGLTPVIGMVASGRAGRRTSDSGSRLQGSGMPMGAGMAAGAMRGATTAGGGAAGRRTGGGSGSLVTNRLTGDDEAARATREKDSARQAVSDAKREAIAEKRAERAARKAARQAHRETELETERENEREKDRDVSTDGVGADGRGVDEDIAGAAPRPANLTVVEIAPDERTGDARL